MAKNKEILAAQPKRFTRGEVPTPCLAKEDYGAALEIQVQRLLQFSAISEGLAGKIADALYSAFQLGSFYPCPQAEDTAVYRKEDMRKVK